jgi:hypothetical protein
VFRESLGFVPIDEGYQVASFSSGGAALEYFVAGGSADAGATKPFPLAGSRNKVHGESWPLI